MGPCRCDSMWIEHGPRSLIAVVKCCHFLQITGMHMCENKAKLEEYRTIMTKNTENHNNWQEPHRCIRCKYMYAQSYGLEHSHHAGIGTIITSSTIMRCERKTSKSETIFGNIIQSCKGMKTKHWPRQPKTFLISSWFRFVNWWKRPTAQHPQLHILQLALQ